MMKDLFKFVLVVLMVSSCKKDVSQENTSTNQPTAGCSWSSVQNDQCLIKTEESIFYNIDGTYNQLNNPFMYNYSNGLLNNIVFPIYPKSAMQRNFYYNVCNQLQYTEMVDTRNPDVTRQKEYCQFDNTGRLIKKIFKWKYYSGDEILTSTAYYQYQPLLNTMYQYDTLMRLIHNDSIVLNNKGNIVEKWSFDYDFILNAVTALKELRSNPDKPGPSVGDHKTTFINNELSLDDKLDSIYLNEYGYDTCLYYSRRTLFGYQGMLKVIKTYTCR